MRSSSTKSHRGSLYHRARKSGRAGTGASAINSAPLPGSDSTDNLPPMLPNRSCMAEKPSPVAAVATLNPTPSLEPACAEFLASR